MVEFWIFFHRGFENYLWMVLLRGSSFFCSRAATCILHREPTALAFSSCSRLPAVIFWSSAWKRTKKIFLNARNFTLCGQSFRSHVVKWLNASVLDLHIRVSDHYIRGFTSQLGYQYHHPKASSKFQSGTTVLEILNLGDLIRKSKYISSLSICAQQGLVIETAIFKHALDLSFDFLIGLLFIRAAAHKILQPPRQILFRIFCYLLIDLRSSILLSNLPCKRTHPHASLIPCGIWMQKSVCEHELKNDNIHYHHADIPPSYFCVKFSAYSLCGDVL